MLFHCFKELYSNRYFHRIIETCTILFHSSFYINGCKMHCPLLVKKISSEYQIYSICPQIVSWTCLIYWLFLTLCQYAAFMSTSNVFPSLQIQLCKKKSLERYTPNPLSPLLVPKCASCTEEPGGQTRECQAFLMLQQLARVCNGKRKRGSLHGVLIPFGCARGGWK